jgi:TPR repeat protein
VPSKPKIALLYYSVAAEYRSEAAFLKLGDCYKNGFGIEQDAKEAIRCYEQVAKTNPLALVYLGYFFYIMKINLLARFT